MMGAVLFIQESLVHFQFLWSRFTDVKPTSDPGSRGSDPFWRMDRWFTPGKHCIAARNPLQATSTIFHLGEDP